MRRTKIITVRARGLASGQCARADPAPAEDDEYSVTGSIGMYKDAYPEHVHFADWINFTGTAQIFDNGAGTTRAVIKGTATGLTGAAYTAEFRMAWHASGTSQTAADVVFISWQITQRGGSMVSEARDVLLRATTLDNGFQVILLDRPLLVPAETRGYSLNGFLGIRP
jgi:hypothetical protein